MADQFLDIFDPNGSVPVFGAAAPDRGTYPNDAIVLDIYNFTNDYIESTYRVENYFLEDNLQVSLDVEEELKRLQYYSGKYNIVGRFFRNHLGSGDGDRLVIEEVSSDRFEIRVTPQVLLTGSQYTNNNLISYFESGFFSQNKEEILPNLFIFKSTFESVKVFDYVQDPFTFDTPPYSIIFKLGAPLPQTIQLGDIIWLAQEVSQPLRDSVTVIPVALQSGKRYLAGPNFDVLSDTMTSIGTAYQSWNTVLGTDQPTVLNMTTALFSGSLVEGIPLNVDFRRFENFVRFGSAEERVRNFFYKLTLVERYDAIINALTIDYDTNNWAADVTASAGYLNNLNDARIKRNNLLGTFDSYEKYLYFESSSYVSNSFGEFTPSTWPKTTSAKPHINHPSTSSIGYAWFEEAVASASRYDIDNQDSLRRLIPTHVAADTANDQFLLFVDMIGHYFDLIYEYINQLPHVTKRYESVTEGFARDLVFEVARSLGLEPENGNAMEDLWMYMLGTDQTGSLQTAYGDTVQDASKEVWKRIITNLPYLLKTKGTARGIRALLNCYGVPSSIIRVREFGGPEATFDSVSQDVFDQFFWGLRISESLGTPSVQLSPAGGATAFEMRFSIDNRILNNNSSYTAGPVTFNPVQGTVTVGGASFANVPLSGSNIDWWSVMVAGGKSYIGATIGSTVYIKDASGGSVPGGFTVSAPSFCGMISEARWWKGSWNDAVKTKQLFEYHVLAPVSYQGPLNSVGSTSSYEDLLTRFPLGGDGNKYNLVGNLPSSHSKQTVNGGTVSFNGFSQPTSSYWIPQTETNYLNFTDGGANRQIGSKIRIEEGVQVEDDQLLIDASIVTSLYDLQPVDSPRLGVYLSPTDEVNEDISEMFGGYNLDDFTGDPAYYYQDDYPALQPLRSEYLKKYTRRNTVQHYIRRMQLYDASLFQLVKQFAPERALLHTGLVIESDVLHRTRIGQKKPSSQELHYSSSLDAQIVDFGGNAPMWTGTLSTADDNIVVAEVDDTLGIVDAAIATQPQAVLQTFNQTNSVNATPGTTGSSLTFTGSTSTSWSNTITSQQNIMVMNSTPSDILLTNEDALGGMLQADVLAFAVNNTVMLPSIGISNTSNTTVTVQFVNGLGAVIAVKTNNSAPAPD